MSEHFSIIKPYPPKFSGNMINTMDNKIKNSTVKMSANTQKLGRVLMIVAKFSSPRMSSKI